MSNIYILEPACSGKVLLKTTVGDLDIEIWSREAPLACRNFVQLCMEGYYDGTIFHRVVKDFIVQGGDPTGTGAGGESIYGEPFKDEFHSRLRFTRRGLLGMANSGKNDNGSQFFITLGATPELQNKHTIFGKLSGDTMFNMLKFTEAEIGPDERPKYPHKIISTEIILNPFTDIVPRCVPNRDKVSTQAKQPKSKSRAVKDFNLLSFGSEAEEDEEEVMEIIKKTKKKKPKDDYDDVQIIEDPPKDTLEKLVESVDVDTKPQEKVAEPQAEIEEAKSSDEADTKSNDEAETKLIDEAETKSNDGAEKPLEMIVDSVPSVSRIDPAPNIDESIVDPSLIEADEGSNEEKVTMPKLVEYGPNEDDYEYDEEQARIKMMNYVKDKLFSSKSTKASKSVNMLDILAKKRATGEIKKKRKPKVEREPQNEANNEKESEESNVKAIGVGPASMAQFIKDKLNKSGKSSKLADLTMVQKEKSAMTTSLISEYWNEKDRYKKMKETQPKKGATREQQTLRMLQKFKNKLRAIKDDHGSDSGEEVTEEQELKEEDKWLAHKLKSSSTVEVLAKDANLKSADWYEIYDPRNELNKRRRKEK